MSVIKSEYVLANAFLSTNNERLSIDMLFDYYTDFKKKIESIEQYKVTAFSLERLLSSFDKTFKLEKDDFNITIDKDFDKQILREGLPDLIIGLFEETGNELKMRSCLNCYNSCYITRNGVENLFCIMNEPYNYPPFMVDEDDYCKEHIFVDGNCCKDEKDELHKSRKMVNKKN